MQDDACLLASSKRPCGLMDKALVFGTKGCRIESCQGHFALAVFIATLEYAAAAARRLGQLISALPRSQLPGVPISQLESASPHVRLDRPADK